LFFSVLQRHARIAHDVCEVTHSSNVADR
jgi:hypothetical protein